MVEILALVLQHDEQAVLTAVELALEAGAPTKTHILNVLHRLIDGKPIDPPAVKPPHALTLTTEPQATSSDTTPCAKPGRRAMRHNPAAGAIIIMLRTLKMHGMAQAVGELTEQGSPAFEAAVPILSQLLKAETADREVRSTAYQLKAARFPNYRDLAGFDFASSEVNEALVDNSIAASSWKMLTISSWSAAPARVNASRHRIGVQAIEHHRKRVRFFSTVELVNALEQEKLQGKPGQIGRGSPTPISSSSTNSATCRSAPPAGRCSSIC